MEAAPRPDPDGTHEPRPRAWLVRHGETEWAREGRHTSRTDVPLTDLGRSQAVAAGRKIRPDRDLLDVLERRDLDVRQLHAGGVVGAVAERDLVEVLLVVVLGEVELRSRWPDDLGRDLAVPGSR